MKCFSNQHGCLTKLMSTHNWCMERSRFCWDLKWQIEWNFIVSAMFQVSRLFLEWYSLWKTYNLSHNLSYAYKNQFFFHFLCMIIYLQTGLVIIRAVSDFISEEFELDSPSEQMLCVLMSQTLNVSNLDTFFKAKLM